MSAIATKKKKVEPYYIVCATVLGLFTLTVLYPFIYLIAVSFSSTLPVMQNRVWLFPVDFTVEAYVKLTGVHNFLRSYMNTVIYTVTGTLVGVGITCLTAYPLSKPYLKGRRFFNLMCVVTMMFGGGLVASYINYRQLGMLNTIWVIILPGAMSVYNMILTRTYFESISPSLEESAKLDGAGDLTVFARIYMPLSTPIISTIVLFIAVGRWNSWFHEFIVLKDSIKYPVQLVVRSVVLSGEVDLSQQLAMGDEVVNTTSLKYALIIVTMVPMLLFYPFIQKYLIKGIMVGAIKG